MLNMQYPVPSTAQTSSNDGIVFSSDLDEQSSVQVHFSVLESQPKPSTQISEVVFDYLTTGPF